MKRKVDLRLLSTDTRITVNRMGKQSVFLTLDSNPLNTKSKLLGLSFSDAQTPKALANILMKISKAIEDDGNNLNEH